VSICAGLMASRSLDIKSFTGITGVHCSIWDTAIQCSVPMVLRTSTQKGASSVDVTALG
jgi:hypothetical protein